jgi:hypothetical protein
MSKLKIFGVLISLVCVGCFVYYASLSPLKKNLAKSKILHWAHIVNPDWDTTITKSENGYVADFSSSTLVVDGIIKSMKGPVSYKIFLLNDKEEELYWITGMDVKANSKYNSEGISNDFICHTNLYHNDVEHFARMGLEERNNLQHAQAITLTKGDLFFDFPEGFGYPLFSNEKIYLGSQALNLNIENPLFTVDFNFKLKFEKDREQRLKPLYMRYVVVSLPYDIENKEISTIFQENRDNKVSCVALDQDGKYFNRVDENGEPTTVFWLVPKGKHTYRSDFTKSLALDTIVTLHKINAHVHPYATSIALRDKTIDSTVFKAIVTNYKKKVGLDNITSFTSKKGIKMYPDHDYELVEEVNNTSNQEVEMMGSMFLYFYDHELDKKLDSISPQGNYKL